MQSNIIPGAERIVFKRGVHMPHIEEPRLYKEKLRKFLEKVEQS